ncbi:unnamed protein product [Pylaiella littoralis]
MPSSSAQKKAKKRLKEQQQSTQLPKKGKQPERLSSQDGGGSAAGGAADMISNAQNEESHDQTHSSPKAHDQPTEETSDSNLYTLLSRNDDSEVEEDDEAGSAAEQVIGEEGEVAVETCSAVSTTARPQSSTARDGVHPRFQPGGAIESYILEKFRQADEEGTSPPKHVMQMVTGSTHGPEIDQLGQRLSDVEQALAARSTPATGQTGGQARTVSSTTTRTTQQRDNNRGRSQTRERSASKSRKETHNKSVSFADKVKGTKECTYLACQNSERRFSHTIDECRIAASHKKAGLILKKA